MKNNENRQWRKRQAKAAAAGVARIIRRNGEKASKSRNNEIMANQWRQRNGGNGGGSE